MADRKISELTNLTGANLADDDEFPLVDTSADETKAITFGEFKTALDTATGFVRITGDTMTGNLSMGDNVKAIFGNGSDLQIYHDGSNSYVQDTAAGELILKSNGPSISFQKGDGTELFTVNTSGSSTLSYSGNPKLATTSSGVDITGVLTSDSLSVDGGTIKLDGNYPTGTGNVALGDAALDSCFDWAMVTRHLVLVCFRPTRLRATILALVMVHCTPQLRAVLILLWVQMV